MSRSVISSNIPAAYLGATTITNTVGIAALPDRLREDFAKRPWPTHPLTDRIVNRLYIPVPPANSAKQPWVLEIVDDIKIRVDGVERSMVGNNLHLFNLLLLCRDKKLFLKEFVALGFADYLRTDRKKEAYFRTTRERLRQKTVPYDIFDSPGGSRPSGQYRLCTAMRIVDRREYMDAVG